MSFVKHPPILSHQERLSYAQACLKEDFFMFLKGQGIDRARFAREPAVRAACALPATGSSLRTLLEAFQSAWLEAGLGPIMFATRADVLRACEALAYDEGTL